ncbi:MAG: hypothetical protein R3E97_03140 [Candidatus Eisenbacteria bacterium]
MRTLEPRGGVARELPARPVTAEGFTVPFLLLAIACVAPFTITACSDDDPTSPDEHTAIRDFSDMVDATELGLASFEGVNSEIHLHSAETDQIDVHVRVEVDAPRQDDAEEFADSIQMQAETDGAHRSWWFEYPTVPAHMTVTLHWTVEVPDGMDAELDAVNGAFEVSGSFGALDLSIQNGAIDVSGDAGPIVSSGVNAAVDISLDVLEGPLTSTLVNGNQEIGFLVGDTSVFATSVNGSIDVRLPHSYDGTLDAEVENGVVSAVLSLGDAQITTKHVTGRIGDGSDHTVVLRSVNGNIVVAQHSS